MNVNDDMIDVVDSTTTENITIEEAMKKYEPMVHRFVNSAHTNHVVSKEDLCQEGRMAIVVAYQNFDPSRGASLTTWTYHMIKDAILEYQKQHLSILSGGAYLQSVLRKAGKDASIDQIMEFGVSKKTALAATYVKESFSSVDYDELATMVGDTDMEAQSVESFDWKSHLNDQEIFAVGSFYGFNGKRMTLQEIGDQMGKSRKAVSYLINKAIVKLRHIPGIELYAFEN